MHVDSTEKFGKPRIWYRPLASPITSGFFSVEKPRSTLVLSANLIPQSGVPHVTPWKANGA
jgi:hypothetical protein